MKPEDIVSIKVTLSIPVEDDFGAGPGVIGLATVTGPRANISSAIVEAEQRMINEFLERKYEDVSDENSGVGDRVFEVAKVAGRLVGMEPYEFMNSVVDADPETEAELRNATVAAALILGSTTEEEREATTKITQAAFPYSKYLTMEKFLETMSELLGKSVAELTSIFEASENEIFGGFTIMEV